MNINKEIKPNMHISNIYHDITCFYTKCCCM